MNNEYNLTLTLEQLTDLRGAVEDAHITAERSLKALTKECPQNYRNSIEARISRLDQILVQIINK